MGDAYTPGLTVTPSAVVRKTRRLPLPGEVVVRVGDRVRAEDVVARTELPGKVQLVNFANRLGCAPDEVEATLRLEPGARLTPKQLIAEKRAFFGLMRTELRSPIEGTFESVSRVTGQGVLRGLYALPAPAMAGDSRARCTLVGSGAILHEVIEAARWLAEHWGVQAQVCSATSFGELARDGQAAERERVLGAPASLPWAISTSVPFFSSRRL